MNAIPSRDPIRTTDADGTPVVRVPLAKGRGFALLLAEDFDHLAALGLSTRWSFNPNGRRTASTVRVGDSSASGRLLSVGQLVAEAPAGRAVRHINGDRRDLRRGNLELVEHRRSRGRELAWLEERRARLAGAW